MFKCDTKQVIHKIQSKFCKLKTLNLKLQLPYFEASSLLHSMLTSVPGFYY